MIAKDLISDVIPLLKTSDTAQTALNWMEIFHVSHLPIVNNVDYLGLISDSDIYDLNMPDEAVGNHKLSLQRPFVRDVAQLVVTQFTVADMREHGVLSAFCANNLVSRD